MADKVCMKLNLLSVDDQTMATSFSGNDIRSSKILPMRKFNWSLYFLIHILHEGSEIFWKLALLSFRSLSYSGGFGKE